MSGARYLNVRKALLKCPAYRREMCLDTSYTQYKKKEKKELALTALFFSQEKGGLSAELKGTPAELKWRAPVHFGTFPAALQAARAEVVPGGGSLFLGVDFVDLAARAAVAWLISSHIGNGKSG